MLPIKPGRSIWETNAQGLKQHKGSNCPALHTVFYSRTGARVRDRESIEGRQFAIMAALGLDMLWILCSVPLIFLNNFVSGSTKGMCSICSEVKFQSF